MKRKALLLLVVMMALVGTLVPGGLVAAEDVGVLFPFDPGPHTFDTGQPFQIGWMWLATTKGLVNVFYQHSEISYLLVNEAGDVVWSLSAAESPDYFQPIEARDPADLGLVCPMPRLFTTDWWSNEIVLDAPGTYTLLTSMAVNNPINDGWHTCTDMDGNPISRVPSLMTPFDVTIPATILIDEPAP